MMNAPADKRPRVVRIGLQAICLLRPALLGIAWTVVAALSAVGLIHALGLRAWPFELVHHFIAVYVLAATAVLLFALFVRNLRLTAATGSLFAFFVWVLAAPLPAEVPPPAPVIEASNAPLASTGTTLPIFSLPPIAGQPPAAPPVPAKPEGTFSIITNNVYCANWNRDGLIRWLRTRPADVVVLQEVPPPIDKLLPTLSEAYPFSSRISSAGPRVQGVVEACQGMVVLSTFPIITATKFQPVATAWPALLASLQIDDATRVSLAVVHAADPIRADGLAARDAFLHYLAEHLDTIHSPLIVLGDFNASPFTPAFREFQARTGLQLSPWNPATYPAGMRTLGISIDHVLVRDATLLRLEPLSSVGSDHRPLRALISVPVVGSAIPAGLAEDGKTRRTLPHWNSGEAGSGANAANIKRVVALNPVSALLLP